MSTKAPTIDLPLGAPAILSGLHQSNEHDLQRQGYRSVKMLRPICHECAADTAIAGVGWWDRCPHSPYMHYEKRANVTTEHEDILDADGKPTGARRLKGRSVDEYEVPWPNFVPISLAPRVNNHPGLGQETVARSKGYIRPSELRCDAFPNGIAEFCEYLECFAQEGLVEYGDEAAMFHIEAEAAIVYEDVVGRPVEVMNREVREEQYTRTLADLRTRWPAKR